jgi:serine phosphatase RsbU (regulator of sigma subunit)
MQNSRTFLSFCFVLSAFLLRSQFNFNPAKKDSLLQRVSTHLKRDTLRADALLKLGTILYNEGENSERAFEMVKEARKISDSLRFAKGQIGCYVFYGNHYSQHGDYSAALENDLAALKIIEEKKLETDKIRLHRNIGTIYHNTHDYPAALKYYKMALAGAEKLAMKNDIAGLQNNIGIVLHMQKKFDSALVFYELSLKTCEENNNRKTKSYVFNSIGRMYLDRAVETKSEKAYADALRYFELSLALKKELNDQKGIANVIGNIAEVYKSRNQFSEALKYFKMGEEIAKATDYQDWLREGYAGMTDAYEGNGDYKNAFLYHKKFVKVRDSLENLDTKERIARMQGMYDTEQKDKEIQLLHKEKELNDIKDSRKNTLLMSAGIALGVVVLLLTFILRGYQEKKKANKIISSQKTEVEGQKKLVEEKNGEMLDSIRYAKHIQEAILPGASIASSLGEHFILYKAKDIVSGDFYWIHAPENEDVVIAAAIDCTGHGVPGAFVSFVGHSSLVRCINEFGLRDPGKILDQLNVLVNETLRQRMNDSKVRDGMDVSMIVIDRKKNKLSYAGANNPLYRVRNGSLTETKGNKQPVGTFLEEQNAPFLTHVFDLEKGDLFYIFTDGIADQFGGPKQKKFKYTQLKEVLLANVSLPMETQKTNLNTTFENWKGELEQIDDVCVIGMKI